VTGLQTRVAVDDAALADYADAMRDGARFPPVTVYEDADGTLYLADGYHRVGAAKIAGKSLILAEVTRGTFADALKFALGANANHGLRRTNADKRHALEMAWENRRALFGRDDADPSAEILADVCGVTSRFVKSFLAEFQPVNDSLVENTKTSQNKLPPPQRRVFGKDGKTRTVPVRPVVNRAMNGAAQNPPTRPMPTRTAPPVKKGYHIGADGKQHADGVLLDRFGVEIPDALRAVFNSTHLADWEHRISMVKSEIKGARALGNPIAKGLQRAVIELDNAYHEVKAAEPWCVCRVCQGQGCKACGDNGYQTEEQYKRNPDELR